MITEVMLIGFGTSLTIGLPVLLVGCAWSWYIFGNE